MNRRRPKIAVVGAGIAELSAAYQLLKNGADVTIFERHELVGGDVNSAQVSAWDGSLHSVDAGVTDFNASTFHEFKQFLDELGIEYHSINRSASFIGDERPIPHYYITDHGKITYFKDFLKDPSSFEKEIARFRNSAYRLLEHGDVSESVTLEKYLREHQYSEEFKNYFIYPRASAAFLMPRMPITEFPVKNLIRFMSMHSMVGPHPSKRSVVNGGMSQYLKKVKTELIRLGGVFVSGNPVERIDRDGVEVCIRTLAPLLNPPVFKHLVLAVKPDQVLALLARPTSEEEKIFNRLPNKLDRVVVHTDASILPRSTRSWASFNISLRDPKTAVEPTITFWPNHMDQLNARVPNLFVTLNPQKDIQSACIVKEWSATHPLAHADYAQHQEALRLLQGSENTWYCGSYTKLPFLHENAFRSGAEIATDILATLALEEEPLNVVSFERKVA